ncbi:pectinesterase 53 [Tripterygium wilfordii]|uniref:pectinesterase n=1 Tax=Tripterygium wilfordii TaxID=458696 RepID=A0A7J7CHC9_TRIWF|nr:probable pectinesterase 53 [Tripterygium wilfordii]KAF5733452.1 pectinesterase 53 [Tripterygium wilfordii]
MDSKSSHLPNILFIVCLSCQYFNFSSGIADTEAEYNRWISWHVKNHQRKTTMRGNSANQGPNLDDKLLNAEKKKTTLIVSQDGTGDFKTINEAIASIPKHNTRRVILNIKPGLYREKVNITKDKPFITFFGDSGSENPPTISWNDTAEIVNKTLNSASVIASADYFVAINMKFENTAPHYENGSEKQQAAAIRISGNKAAFYNCTFLGKQDTLYDHKGMHYFNNCYIQGSVDFICGHALSLYEKCVLNSTADKMGFLTAQNRSNATMESGFSFKDCLVTGSGLIYLGRTWGDYSRVVFSYTFMDKIVLPKGWSEMGGHPKNHSTVYYGEYKCEGPGSNLTGRVPWSKNLTDAEAKPFIGDYFVDGDTWLIY